jgi:hypothetical protein
MGNGWDSRQPVLGFIQIVSVCSVVNRLGIDQRVSTKDSKWMGEWMGFETTGFGFYPDRIRVIRG